MRFAIGVPHTRPFEGSFLDSLLGLVRPRDEFLFIRVPDLPVDEARNMIVERFLAHDDLQFLWMLDSDMVFAPQTLERLAGRLDLGHVDMVGALCFCRYRPVVPSLFRDVTKKGWKRAKAWPYLYRREWLRVQVEETYQWLEAHPEAQAEAPVVLDPAPADAMVPADSTGGACVLIPRKVFETMRRPWFRRDDVKKGEDFFFFQKARHLGFKLWIDRSAIVFHSWGDQAIGPKDFIGNVAAWGLPNGHT